MAMSIIVRRPAGLWRRERSMPTRPPRKAASNNLPTTYRLRSCSMAPPGAQCWRDSTKASGELTAQKRIASRVNTSSRNESSQAKRREVREAAGARVDFAARKVREALDTEFFHRKTAENGTIHHRAA